ncbi:uncharacterized protein PAC_11715 [Phialocephala subalpina]|uniref:RING-CH-type domain-containing protein n=1 Tax=Phialocephala subalpina TaxID=576137 RepID=A0A1L7X9U7_9HELO|nr:uncharacterized protein PAC_11715 [Phialocephala subalpina]
MASANSQPRGWLARNNTQDSADSFESHPSSPESPIIYEHADSPPRSLNNPESATASNSKSAPAQASAATPAQDPTPPKEARMCWICQQDDTDDTPENNVWRTPCPCSLTAHDSCLLEWIASEEAPKPGEIAHNHKIKCPQCQTEIKIQRPKDYLVGVVDKVQWAAKRVMLPTALGAAVGCAYSGLLVYGWNAMSLAFGAEETTSILQAGFVDPKKVSHFYELYLRMTKQGIRLLFPFVPAPDIPGNPLLFSVVPLIGPALVLLRTSAADQAFPLLLPLYLIKPSHRNINWPPSPGLAFATIPYLRSLYNGLYRHTFADLEKQWDMAVQRKPREGETAEEIAAQARAEQREEDGVNAIFELEWIEEDEDNGFRDEPEQQVRDRIAARQQGDDGIREELAELAELEQRANNADPGHAHPPPANGEPAAAPPVDGAENEGVAPQPNPPPARRGNRDPGLQIEHNIDIPFVTSTVLGALFFPAISSLMGELLKYALPTKFTSPAIVTRGFWSSEVVNKGLLREKWGRSLVGGCLFVVLKDAVVLYCKWKKARDFGKRRVLDFVGQRGAKSS